MTDQDSGVYSEARYRSISKNLTEKAEQTEQLEEQVQGRIRGGALKPPYSPANLAKLLEINTTHAKCVFSKARNTAGYGLEVIPHPGVEEPDEGQREIAEEFWFGNDSKWQVGPVRNEQATAADVLEMGWIDYEGIGWLSLEMLTQTDGTPIGLAYVPAMTVRRRKDEPGFVQMRRSKLRYFGAAGDRYGDDPIFVDSETGLTGGSVENPANELIFKRNHSPLYTNYGAPDVIPGIPTIEGDDAARDFNIDFFENNAVPRMAVIVEGGELTEAARKDIHDLLHGMRDERHRTVVLEVEKLLEDPGAIAGDEDDINIRIEPLTVGLNEDASFENYRDRNEHELLKVHEVPPIEAGTIKSGAFSTDAQSQRRGYIETVIQPKQEALAQLLFETVHSALGVTDYTVRFNTRGVDTRLQDAQIAQTRIGASQGVMTVNEARSELGLEPFLDDEGNPLPIGERLLADLGPNGGGEPGNGNGGPDDFFDVEAQLPPAQNKLGERETIGRDLSKAPIERVDFDSSNLDAGLYDYGERELYIRFKREDGPPSLYAYVDVPAAEWDALVNAGSHGQYHYFNIRMNYGYVEITNNHERLPDGPAPGTVPEGIPSL